MEKDGVKRFGGEPMRVILVGLLAAIVMTGCAKRAEDDLAKLAAVEVREYEGEALGSLMDFRENSIKGPQHIDIDAYRLEVTGLVDAPAVYTYDQVLDFTKYSKIVTIHCVEGWSVKVFWEGVLIGDLLDASGIAPGANTVIFHSYDGYTTSLPLDYILGNRIMLAYKMNQVVLPPERGFPFQVVAEDRLGYKWAKWVTEIEVSDDPSYKGFWESRGYDNDADLGGR
jgi:DMSO/TMAO reductase YedYZ molybdopterin-dependent catalytic subunit